MRILDSVKYLLRDGSDAGPLARPDFLSHDYVGRGKHGSGTDNAEPDLSVTAPTTDSLIGRLRILHARFAQGEFSVDEFRVRFEALLGVLDNQFETILGSFNHPGAAGAIRVFANRLELIAVTEDPKTHSSSVRELVEDLATYLDRAAPKK